MGSEPAGGEPQASAEGVLRLPGADATVCCVDVGTYEARNFWNNSRCSFSANARNLLSCMSFLLAISVAGLGQGILIWEPS